MQGFPKAWAIALGAIAAFTSQGEDYYRELIILLGLFLLVGLNSASTWMIFGYLVKKLLQKEDYQRWFNFSMAVLLVLSVMPAIRDIIRSVF